MQRTKDGWLLSSKWNICITFHSHKVQGSSRKNRKTIKAKGSICLQWKCICWTWQDCCTHELTVVGTASVRPMQEQTSQNVCMDGEEVQSSSNSCWGAISNWLLLEKGISVYSIQSHVLVNIPTPMCA